MTINAPVQATIITPNDVHDLVMNQSYCWVWGAREETRPPSAQRVWRSGMSAFSATPLNVTFMIAYANPHAGPKLIDFIEGKVTAVKYESGREGMLLIELNSEDRRWTKIHGYYNSNPLPGQRHGWLSLTPRR